MSELKITRKRVLEAADQCSDAKRVLKALFPEAFEPEPGSEIDLSPFVNTIVGAEAPITPSKEYPKCLLLDTRYNWHITWRSFNSYLVCRKP